MKLGVACLLLVGCAAARHNEAEAIHLAQLGNCVDRAPTKAMADDCIAKVQANWGRLPDGGRLDTGAE